MATHRDSLGNSYTSLPKAPPIHKAKATHSAPQPRRSRRRQDPKYPKLNKHAAYRARVGRPNGKGQSGNKAGKNKVSR